MKTLTKPATRPCCHCKRGMIPGNRPSDMWTPCQQCGGTGYGPNIFRIMESVRFAGTFACAEIVCWPGRFHAADIDAAREYANRIFSGALVSVEPVAV